jgi:hypothetical protein
MPKYRFRKAYFICRDNQIFSEFEMVTCYKRLEYVSEVRNNQQRALITDSVKMWNTGKPIATLKVEGFYLVHESLFDEILKEYIK